MEKICRLISILLIIFLLCTGTSLGAFCYVHKLWIKNVQNILSDTYGLILDKKFTDAGSSLILAGVFPSNQENRQKYYEQKAIIAAHEGEVEISKKFFEKTENLSEIGNYYFELIKILDIGNWKLEAGIFENLQKTDLSPISNIQSLISQYNKLDKFQSESPYRELLLSQILIELGELRMAEYVLNQAIKKDPDYRDAYVALYFVETELEKDAGWIEEKIKEVDPDY